MACSCRYTSFSDKHSFWSIFFPSNNWSTTTTIKSEQTMFIFQFFQYKKNLLFRQWWWSMSNTLLYQSRFALWTFCVFFLFCIKSILADYLLQSIDPTVNPCEDFYHFACGTWLKNAHIPEDSTFELIYF